MRARDNPFAVDRVHRLRFRPQGLSWDDAWRRLERLSYRAAIVGPEGSGKTTLLEQLRPKFAEEGWSVRFVRFHRSERPVVSADLFTGLSNRSMLLVDGAEQLGRWAWWRFARRARSAGALIITMHSRGRLPTWIDCQTSPELLDALMGELVGPCEDGGEYVRAMNGLLFVAHRGNLRHVLRAWYDLWSGDAEIASRLRSPARP